MWYLHLLCVVALVSLMDVLLLLLVCCYVSVDIVVVVGFYYCCYNDWCCDLQCCSCLCFISVDHDVVFEFVLFVDDVVIIHISCGVADYSDVIDEIIFHYHIIIGAGIVTIVVSIVVHVVTCVHNVHICIFMLFIVVDMLYTVVSIIIYVHVDVGVI